MTQLRDGGVERRGGRVPAALQAREDLESGREYRSVRAGPGFTRKVLEQIEQEAEAKPRGAAVGDDLLAVLGVLGILAVIVVVVACSCPRTAGTIAARRRACGRCTSRQPVASGDFATGVPAGLAHDRPRADGLGARPGAARRSVQKGADAIRGGGVVSPAAAADRAVRGRGRPSASQGPASDITGAGVRLRHADVRAQRRGLDAATSSSSTCAAGSGPSRRVGETLSPTGDTIKVDATSTSVRDQDGRRVARSCRSTGRPSTPARTGWRADKAALRRACGS